MMLEARGITVPIAGCDIVKDAGFTLRSGEFAGLIGPNGAGKSTLLRAALGLRSRSAGTVTLDGQPFAAMNPRARARAVAWFPQDRRVEWRLTARDIVMLGRFPHRAAFGGPTPACRAAADAALADADASHLADRPVSVLSAGERTRVLLARALAVEAPLLLADEPTAALDPYHQIHVMEILQKRARAGAGVLAVTHDLSLAARFMDRVIVLHRGEVLGDGPPAEMLTPERTGAVYGVDVVSGQRDGQPFILPWARTNPTSS